MLNSQERSLPLSNLPHSDIRKELSGRVRDADMHEMVPARLWTAEFGEFCEPLAKLFNAQPEHLPNALSVKREDTAEINANVVNQSFGKACLAVGAYDLNRRIEMMDAVGIDDAILFGTALNIIGLEFASGVDGMAVQQFKTGAVDFDVQAMGRKMIGAHNDWCIRAAKLSSRLRIVGTVSVDSRQEALAEADRLIANGIKAINIPIGTPIEGKAPCHADNDVLWRKLADNNIPLLLHIGGEKPFLRDPTGWINCPQFHSANALPSEINVDPFSLATCHLAAQNFLTNIVLGGVFERVPNLRCGFMELGASWIGSTCQNMDQWAGQFAKRFSQSLSMSPTEYVRRNVRVSPFTFEPIGSYLKNFPFLEDVLCFSTDYPHFEGGKTPFENMLGEIEPFGMKVAEKFFVSNADWVMPKKG